MDGCLLCRPKFRYKLKPKKWCFCVRRLTYSTNSFGQVLVMTGCLLYLLFVVQTEVPIQVEVEETVSLCTTTFTYSTNILNKPRVLVTYWWWEVVCCTCWLEVCPQSNSRLGRIALVAGVWNLYCADRFSNRALIFITKFEVIFKLIFLENKFMPKVN